MCGFEWVDASQHNRGHCVQCNGLEAELESGIVELKRSVPVSVGVGGGLWGGRCSWWSWAARPIRKMRPIVLAPTVGALGPMIRLATGGSNVLHHLIFINTAVRYRGGGGDVCPHVTALSPCSCQDDEIFAINCRPSSDEWNFEALSWCCRHYWRRRHW